MKVTLIKMNVNRIYTHSETFLERFFSKFSEGALFGSLVFAWKNLFPSEFNALMEQFYKDPPLLISGAFPWIEYEGREYFFIPKPLLYRDLRRVSPSITDSDLLKDWKNLQWIPIDYLPRLIEKNFKSDDDLIDFVNEVLELHHKMNEMIVIKRLMRTQIDRIKSESDLRNEVYVYFTNRSGIYYFMAKRECAEFNDSVLGSQSDFFWKYIVSALNLIRDEGFGGKRSVGSGEFDLEIVEDGFEIPEYHGDENESGKYQWLLLSHYKPLRSEVDSIFEEKNIPYSAWKFIEAQGRIAHPSRSITFIVPPSTYISFGSVLISREMPTGRCEKILISKSEKIPIYRYGYAFPVKIGKV